MPTVFYSWQSDLPPKTNRNLIEAALEKAIRQINKDPELVPSPSDKFELVKDTRGDVGSPDIVYAILDKIEKAEICVFDVSIVGRVEKRAFPNSNVLVELGWALKARGAQRIIMVFNSATGDPRHDLPFDLGFKRAMKFEAAVEDEDIADRRQRLSVELEHALRGILEHLRRNRFSSSELEFFTALHLTLRRFLDGATEFPERISKRSTFQSDCGGYAAALREFSADAVARADPNLVTNLKDLAERFDSISRYKMGMPNGKELLRMTEEVAKMAQPLVEKCQPAIRQLVGEHDFSDEKLRLAHRAIDEFSRLDEGLRERSKGLRDIRASLSGIGRELLELAGQLEALKDPDSELLRRVGHALHLAEPRGTEQNGYRPEEELRDGLAPHVADLRSLIGE